MPAPGLYRRDSIGKADQSQDIYSVVRNPHAHGPSKSHQVKKVSLDHLETSAERIQRQQMESLKLGYLKIMGEDGSAIKLITVAAKYLFMAAVFPPYMLLYVIPEFILMKMIPKMIKESIKMLERLPEWFSNTTAWLPNPNQILSQLIKPFAVAKQSLQDFLQMMKHSTQRARKALGETFKKGLQLAAIPFVRTAQIFKDIGLGLKTAAKEIGKQAVKINEKVEQVIQAAKENIAAIVIPIFQPVVQWMEAKYNYATDVAKKGTELVTKTVYKTIEKVKEKLMPPVEKAVRMTKQAAQWVSNKFYMAAKPLVAWAQPKVEKAKELLKKAQKQVEKIREKASQTVENIRQQVAAFVVPFVVQGQNLINLMVTAPIVRLFKKGNQAKSFKQKAKDFGKNSKKALQYIKSAIESKIKKTVGYFGSIVRNVLARLRTFILDLPRRALNGLVRVGKFSIRFCKATWAFLVKSCQVARLLFQFGMQLIRELKADISLYLSHARSETRS